MAKIVRRAAKKAIINAKDGHGLLGLVIFDEKLVYEQFRKLVDSKACASLSLLKWARQEDNLALQDVFSKVFEVGSIWTAVMKRFTDEYLQYRTAFKDVLREEREVDEIRKKEIAYTTKLNKLQKQLDQMKRKSDVSKPKAVVEEISEILSKAEEAHAELEVKVTKHEIYKARKLRESLYLISDSIETLAEQTLSVGASYRKLADMIPDTPTQLSEEKIYPGIGQTRQIVTSLANELEIEPAVTSEIAAMGKNAQTYLYAVSAVKQERSELSTSPPPPGGFFDGRPTKNRTPPPLPHVRKTSDENLANQNFGRPFSMDDLRPPPSVPPPPIPTRGGPLSPDRLNHPSPPPPPRCRITGPKLEDQNFARPHSLNDLRPPPLPLKASSRDATGRLRINSADERKPPLRKVSDPVSASSRQNSKLWYARSGRIQESDSEDSDGYTEPMDLPPNYYPSRTPNKRPAIRLASDGVVFERSHAESAYAERKCVITQSRTVSETAYKSLNRSDTGDTEPANTETDYLELFNT